MASRVFAAVLAGVLLLGLAGVPAGPVSAAPPTAPEDKAIERAKKSGKPVEITGRTSQTRKLTAMPDGTLKFESSAAPQRVKRGGKWSEIDLSLVKRQGRIVPNASAADVEFSAGGTAPFIVMKKGNKSLSLTPKGVAELPEPVLAGAEARYVDALAPGIDLVARADRKGVSHYVVARTAEAADDPLLRRIEFTLEGSGLKVNRRKGNAVTVSDEAGDLWASAKRPYMWKAPADGRVDGDGESEQAPVGVEVDGDRLTLVPDAEALRRQGAESGVVIDPPWQIWHGDAEGLQEDVQEDGNFFSKYVNAAAPDTSYAGDEYMACSWDPETTLESCSTENRLNVGHQSGTQKWISYFRMDTSPVWTWTDESNSPLDQVKINSVKITFDVRTAAACKNRYLRLFNVENKNAGAWTWNNRPALETVGGVTQLAGFDVNGFNSLDQNTCQLVPGQDVEITDERMKAWFTHATRTRRDFMTLGVFPSATYYDATAHTWVGSADADGFKQLDADPRIEVAYSRQPYAPTGLEVGDTGNVGGGVAGNKACPAVVGIATGARRMRAVLSDPDSDRGNDQQVQPLRGRFEVKTAAGQQIMGFDDPDAVTDFKAPEASGPLLGKSEATLDITAGRLPDTQVDGPDGGTPYTFRALAEDDTFIRGTPAECFFTVDQVRPKPPTVWSAEYPKDQFGGYNPATRSYGAGTFVFGPNGSGDVKKFHYSFSNGVGGVVQNVAPGGSGSRAWQPTQAGPQWVEVWSEDKAGNLSNKTRYEFGLKQPPRDAAWSMDEITGNVAKAAAGTGVARPNADLTLHDAERNHQGNIQGVLEDRSVRFKGVSGSYGEVAASTDPANGQLPLVDTSKPFMLSSWVKLRTTARDQGVVSFMSTNGARFQLGWFGGRWKFRHVRADGSAIAEAVGGPAQPDNGSAWTDNWVSLMAGYEPANRGIWIRAQSPDNFAPDCLGGWQANPDLERCDVLKVMDPPDPIKLVADNEPTSPGAGSFVVGAAYGSGGSLWGWLDGQVDDTQIWPLSHTQKAVLNAMYGETVQPLPLKGGALGSTPDGMVFRFESTSSPGKCLDNIDSHNADGGDAAQYGCFTDENNSPWPNQDWLVTEVGLGEYTLTSMKAQKAGRALCLTVNGERTPELVQHQAKPDGSTRTPEEQAANANLWPCQDWSEDQIWVIAPVTGGYQLVSRQPAGDGSTLCLEVDNGSQDNNADAITGPCTGPTDADPQAERAARQVWTLRSANGEVARFADGADRRVVNVNSGMCLDVPAAGAESGIKLWQWTCNSSKAQDWRLTQVETGKFILTNPTSGLCLDVPNATAKLDGEQVQQWTCNDSQPQTFKTVRKPGGYWLVGDTTVNDPTPLCLSVQGNAPTRGETGPVVMSACGGAMAPSQLWDLSVAKRPEIDLKTFRLRNIAGGTQCLDVPWASTEEGVALQVANCNTSGAQDWLFTPVGDGQYTLRNAVSGRCVDVAAASTAPGATIQQWTCNYTDAQLWQVAQVSNNAQRFSGTQLINKGSGLALETAGGNTAEGTPMSQGSAVDPALAYQTWILEPVDGDAQDPPPLMTETFMGPDGLVTNEYAYWNPGATGIVTSPVWEVTSGSLFRRGGMAWSGVPDAVDPDATSGNGTGSNKLHVRTKRRDFGDVRVDLRMRVLGFASNAAVYDGTHVTLRHQSDSEFYYVSLRKDGGISVKKVLAGDPVHHWIGGATLPVPVGEWQNLSVTVTGSGTSVVIRIYAQGREVLTVTDTGSAGGRTISAPGAVGFRSDNSEAEFDDVKVWQM